MLTIKKQSGAVAVIMESCQIETHPRNPERVILSTDNYEYDLGTYPTAERAEEVKAMIEQHIKDRYVDSVCPTLSRDTAKKHAIFEMPEV